MQAGVLSTKSHNRVCLAMEESREGGRAILQPVLDPQVRTRPGWLERVGCVRPTMCLPCCNFERVDIGDQFVQLCPSMYCIC